MGEPLQKPRRTGSEARIDRYRERVERAAANLAALGVSRPEDLSREERDAAISSGKIGSFDVLEIEELEYASKTILKVVPSEKPTGPEIDKGDI